MLIAAETGGEVTVDRAAEALFKYGGVLYFVVLVLYRLGSTRS